MVSGKRFGSAAVSTAPGSPHFDLPAARRIWLRANHPVKDVSDAQIESLCKRLNIVAATLVMRRMPGSEPTASERAKRFEKIAAAAQQLLTSLSVKLDQPSSASSLSGAPPFVQRGLSKNSRTLALQRLEPNTPVMEIGDTLKGVRQIYLTADLARRQANLLKIPQPAVRETQDDPPATHAPDEALNECLCGLRDIWHEEFGRTDVLTKAFNSFATTAISAVEYTTDQAVRRRAERLFTQTS